MKLTAKFTVSYITVIVKLHRKVGYRSSVRC